MVRCSVPGCPNNQVIKYTGVTFHNLWHLDRFEKSSGGGLVDRRIDLLFPKDEARRRKWLVAVGRQHWTPTPNSVVCSAHFTEENMDRTSLMYVRLRPDAVPSIFSSDPVHHLPTNKKPGRAKAKQQSKRHEVERECRQNVQIEDSLGEQHHEAALNSECDSVADESAEGFVVLTRIKKENEADVEEPESVLLKWSEVETDEHAPRSPVASPQMVEDNKQKPSLTEFLEWREVGAASGSGVQATSNCITPHVQTVLCTPDTPCEVPLKRKPNTRVTEPEWRKRKTEVRKHQQNNAVDEWDIDQQVEVNLRAVSPEALLLECCAEDETCDSENAASIMSTCSTPQELSVMCTTDMPDIELLKKQLCRSSEKLQVARKKIKSLLQNRRRYQKRIASLKGTCSELRSKNLLNEDKISFLEKTLGESYRELFERKSINSSGTSLPLNYSAQLREFATKLYFYSRDAYHYMRQTFQNCLPHPGTLRRWNNPFQDCPPGLDISNAEMFYESASESDAMGEAGFVSDSPCNDPTAMSSTDLIHKVDGD